MTLPGGHAPGRTRAERRPLRLSVRFGLTTIDQCISSLSNFAVGIGTARVAGLVGFGAYSLVYAVWLVLAAAHRALITDPMAINNDASDRNAARHVRVGLAAELSLGLAAALTFALIGAVLIGCGQHAFGISFLGLAPWVPCLLVQDYWRWVSFMKHKPQQALANDALFDAVQLVGFAALFALGVRTEVLPVTAWGLGAFVGACYGVRQHATWPTLQSGIRRIRRRWSLSKWLMLTDVAGQATSQAAAVLTGSFLGPTGIGGLKAASTLVGGPSLVLLMAGGNIGLPEAAKSLRERGWVGLRRTERLVTVAGMASVGLVAVVVFAFAQTLLEALYGPSFGRFATVAEILAIGYLLSTFGLGAILSLKVTRQTRQVFRVSVFSIVVSVTSVVVLAPLYGLDGAAWATVIGQAASMSGMLTMHLRHSRRAAEAMDLAAPTSLTGAGRARTDGAPADGRVAATVASAPAAESDGMALATESGAE